MTQDKIIRMVREAGASDLGINAASPNVLAMFERFAALVAAAEREACAQACAEISKDYWMGDCQFEAATRCAAAIRARNTK